MGFSQRELLSIGRVEQSSSWRNLEVKEQAPAFLPFSLPSQYHLHGPLILCVDCQEVGLPYAMILILFSLIPCSQPLQPASTFCLTPNVPQNQRQHMLGVPYRKCLTLEVLRLWNGFGNLCIYMLRYLGIKSKYKHKIHLCFIYYCMQYF
jgi:hypothetical protein